MAQRPAPIPKAITELWELVLAYFKQETAEPLKAMGRVLAYGIAGSLLIGFGVIFIAIGLLRVLQEQSAFAGNWKFAPYVIIIVALIGTAVGVYTLGTRTKDSR